MLAESAAASRNLNPTHNHTNMAVSTSKYQVFHCINSIFGAGARCRICARVYSPSRHLPPGLCALHDFGVTSEEAVLGRLAIEMQDAFFARRELEWQEAGRNVVPRFPGWTDSEYWTWISVNMLWCECEKSIFKLSPVWICYQAGHYNSRKSLGGI